MGCSLAWAAVVAVDRWQAESAVHEVVPWPVSGRGPCLHEEEEDYAVSLKRDVYCSQIMRILGSYPPSD